MDKSTIYRWALTGRVHDLARQLVNSGLDWIGFALDGATADVYEAPRIEADSISEQGIQEQASLKRLLPDACQFARSQSFVSSRFGRPFCPSREFAEIDIN